MLSPGPDASLWSTHNVPLPGPSKVWDRKAGSLSLAGTGPAPPAQCPA